MHDVEIPPDTVICESTDYSREAVGKLSMSESIRRPKWERGILIWELHIWQRPKCC